MIGLVILLIIVGVILAIFGFAIKTLFWLAIIGIVIVVIGALLGFIRRGGSRV